MRSVLLVAAAASAYAALPAGFSTYFVNNVSPFRNSARLVRHTAHITIAPMQCPSGWEEIPEAKGRVVVSVIDPTIAGITVG